MKRSHVSRILSAITLATFGAQACWASVMVPYTADSTTLHLWHLDEPADNAEDTGFVNANDIDLKSVGFLGAYGSGYNKPAYTGFGTSVGIVTLPQPAVGAAMVPTYHPTTTSQSQLQGANGAFTYEMMLKFTDTTNRPSFLMGMEDTTASWQWFYNNNGTIVFRNAGATIINVGVTNNLGAHAINTTDWFHAAITYDGTSQTRFYWTKVGPSQTNANLVATGSMGDLPSSANVFTIGNRYEVGQVSNAPLQGFLDEVRISSAALTADQFIFVVPEPSTVMLLLVGGGLLWRRQKRQVISNQSA